MASDINQPHGTEDAEGDIECVEVEAFGHRFIEFPGNAEDLMSLEREGAIYAHFWHEETSSFRYYRIRFRPDEIFRYVEAHVARQEFHEAMERGADGLEEGLAAVTNKAIAQRVLAYNDYGRTPMKDGSRYDNRGCAASFYGEDLEGLVCGQKLERYELLPSLSSGDSLGLLLQVLNSFPVLARLLGRRSRGKAPFVIADEYDVQDLLFVAIRAVFEDARLEEWTPKHAGTSKRIDIVVPSLDAAIEVKRVRDREHARRVADELKIDIESFHSHPNCRMLLAIIFDPHHHILDPVVVSNDLSGIRVKGSHTFDVKVMVRS